MRKAGAKQLATTVDYALVGINLVPRLHRFYVHDHQGLSDHHAIMLELVVTPSVGGDSSSTGPHELDAPADGDEGGTPSGVDAAYRAEWPQRTHLMKAAAAHTKLKAKVRAAEERAERAQAAGMPLAPMPPRPPPPPGIADARTAIQALRLLPPAIVSSRLPAAVDVCTRALEKAAWGIVVAHSPEVQPPVSQALAAEAEKAALGTTAAATQAAIEAAASAAAAVDAIARVAQMAATVEGGEGCVHADTAACSGHGTWRPRTRCPRAGRLAAPKRRLVRDTPPLPRSGGGRRRRGGRHV